MYSVIRALKIISEERQAVKRSWIQERAWPRYPNHEAREAKKCLISWQETSLRPYPEMVTISDKLQMKWQLLFHELMRSA